MEEKNATTADDYFKSEERKIIFAILYTDTSLKEKLLGISGELYLNKDKAKEWRNYLVKKIHSDIF